MCESSESACKCMYEPSSKAGYTNMKSEQFSLYPPHSHTRRTDLENIKQDNDFKLYLCHNVTAICIKDSDNHRLRYGGKNEATTYDTSKLQCLKNGIFIYAHIKVTF